MVNTISIGHGAAGSGFHNKTAHLRELVMIKNDSPLFFPAYRANVQYREVVIGFFRILAIIGRQVRSDREYLFMAAEKGSSQYVAASQMEQNHARTDYRRYSFEYGGTGQS